VNKTVKRIDFYNTYCLKTSNALATLQSHRMTYSIGLLENDRFLVFVLSCNRRCANRRQCADFRPPWK